MKIFGSKTALNPFSKIGQMIITFIIVLVLTWLVMTFIVPASRNMPACKTECVLREDCPMMNINTGQICEEEGKVCCLFLEDLTGNGSSSGSDNGGDESEICPSSDFPIGTSVDGNPVRGICTTNSQVEYCVVDSGVKSEVNACEDFTAPHIFYMACCEGEDIEDFENPEITISFGEARSETFSRDLYINTSLYFYVSSSGEEVSSCNVRTYDFHRGRYIVDGGLAIDYKQRGNCDDYEIEFNPSEEDYDSLVYFNYPVSFELTVILKDSSEGIIEEKSTRFTIRRS